MNVPTKQWLGRVAVLSFMLFLPACDSRASRAAAAFDQYQTAAAAGDLRAERTALLALTAAAEDNASYWTELGKVQLQLRDLAQAYNAFTRANELDRSNTDVLRYLIQIALQSGNLDAADQHSKELDLIAPGDPMVKVTGGLISLKRHDFDGALKQADAFLATSPLDANAIVLKARALVGLGRINDAITLLDQQNERQPGNPMVVRALMGLNRKLENWTRVVALGRSYLALAPDDRETGLVVLAAAFKVGDIGAARAISSSFLKPNASFEDVDAVLTVWREHWKAPEAVALAKRFAASASAEQQVAYARYFNFVGAPAIAAQLVQAGAAKGLSPETMDDRAVFLGALAKLGRQSEARHGLQEVLARDPENDLALEALAPLLSQAGNKQESLNVARKLVTVDPTSVDARLTLAQCYEAAGDRPAAVRALWDAFHDIPAAERIYTRLRAYLGPQSDEARQLDADYADQIQRKITQETA